MLYKVEDTFELAVNNNLCHLPLFTLRNQGNKRIVTDNTNKAIIEMISGKDLPHGDDDKIFYHMLALCRKNKTNMLVFRTATECMAVGDITMPVDRFEKAVERLMCVSIIAHRWVEKGKKDKIYFGLFEFMKINKNKKEHTFIIKLSNDLVKGIDPTLGYWTKLLLSEFDRLTPLARKLYMLLLPFQESKKNIHYDVKFLATKLGMSNTRSIRNIKREIDKAIKEIDEKTRLNFEMITFKRNKNVMFSKKENLLDE